MSNMSLFVRVGNQLLSKFTVMGDGIAYCFNGLCSLVSCTEVPHVVSICGQEIGRVMCHIGDAQSGVNLSSENPMSLNFPCDADPESADPYFFAKVGMGISFATIVTMGTAYGLYQKHQSNMQRDVGVSNDQLVASRVAYRN